MVLVACAGSDVMDIDGVFWRYYISNDRAIVMGCSYCPPNCILPAYIRGYPVSSFYSDTFYNCAITNIVVPANFTGDIDGRLFDGQRGKLTSVMVASGNGKYASLDGLLYNKNQTLLIYVPPYAVLTCIPNTVTNISESALISCDHATAQWIKSSVCLQSSTEREVWAQKNKMFMKNTDGNISSALRLRSGKVDGAGRQMYVWEDYVAGTNPLETKDVFHAVIAIERGEVKISWSPELPPNESAKRLYTIYGKTGLSDGEWVPISAEADKSAYRFFKVGVELR